MDLSALQSGKYHDLIIRCESREWKVHRVILCASSDYFGTICEATFKVRAQQSSKPVLMTAKEGLSGEIDLKDDEPDMVDNMLQFLYTSNYQDNADGGRPLLVNAKMYSIGDKYNIPTLKTLATEKFSAALGASWDIVGFPEVIETVYTTTPGSDRGLRDCLAPVLVEHKKELHDHEGFVGLVRNKLADGDFAVDVINVWTGHQDRNKCKHCAVRITKCHSCGWNL